MTPDPEAGPAIDPTTIKACCAAGYSSDVVTMLLGDSYHPGGLTLTRRLLDRLDLHPDALLLDVASGIGTTCLLAATEYGTRAVGVDLSAANVTLARGAAAARHVSDRVRFHQGDAETLPVDDGRADAVVCECALCTFPDKPATLHEMARVLRPGGRLGITDITADRDRLPHELTGMGAWIACVADARPLSDYERMLRAAGLRLRTEEHQHGALPRMIDQIEARLDLLRMTARPRLDALGIDLAQARTALHAARAAVLDGILAYVLIVAEKPAR
jgi:arsenite methyltransferase